MVMVSGGLIDIAVSVTQRNEPEQHGSDQAADRHDDRHGQQLLVAERHEKEAREDGRARRTGATDTEIKIGNTMPYSGPASPLGITGRVLSAYFEEINEKGGINGRKINLLSLDDAFSPPKTMEAARRLVEGDGVAFIFATMGTAPSSAIETPWKPFSANASAAAPMSRATVAVVGSPDSSIRRAMLCSERCVPVVADMLTACLTRD